VHEPAAAPDDTAVRVALWRALHVEVDAPPHEAREDFDRCRESACAT
jgi:hypothetical protein